MIPRSMCPGCVPGGGEATGSSTIGRPRRNLSTTSEFFLTEGAVVVTATAGLWLAQQQDDPQLFLGEDFLPWMVLAFGAAMVVGPLLALVRPPARDDADAAASDPPRPPIARTVAMMVIGAVAAIWGLASLLS